MISVILSIGIGTLVFVSVLYLIISTIIDDSKHDKLIKETINNMIVCSTNTEPFSVSKYLERIEAEHIALLEQKERRNRLDDTRVLILWLGLDGLRLNENGELEWIRRNGEKNEEKSAPVPSSQRVENIPFNTGMLMGIENCYNASALKEIQQLQMKNTLLQCQAFMYYQTQNTINSMVPNYSFARFSRYGQFNPYYYNPPQQYRWF